MFIATKKVKTKKENLRDFLMDVINVIALMNGNVKKGVYGMIIIGCMMR
jgi:hypothetical protein